MISGIRLPRFFGFEVRIDNSWFVVFLLVLWTFAQYVFPARVAGYGATVYGAMAFAGAVLFFGSVLLHEVAHSVVARARGIPVEGITLFIFGGTAQVRSEVESPRDEFLITVVGPLSSAVVGIVLLVVARVSARWGVPEPVTGVAEFVALLNFILAGFNLIPGFPLDGGRIFRSLVWHVSKDLQKATRWASYTGRGFGLLLIGSGIYRIYNGGLVEGMWLIFIGWFLAQAAEASYRQVMLRRILEGVKAREAMTRAPETLRPELTLRDVVDQYFLRRRYNSFPVEDERGNLLGLITLSQVKEVERDSWPTIRVGEVMMTLSEAVTVRSNDTLADVLSKLETAGVGRALVIDNGRLEGVISNADIAQWLERYQQLS